MDKVILVINAGSSSLKFSIFASRALTFMYHGEVSNILDAPMLIILDENQRQVLKQPISLSGYNSALKCLFDWLDHLPHRLIISAVGHRVVHGGTFFKEPTLVTDSNMEKMASLNSLAPLHQPHDLAVIKAIQMLYPSLPQIACFDTTFHRTQDKLATLFAIPRQLTQEGIIRYGFHGISYEYIASVLPQYLNEKADANVIVAHLGHGASMCAMKERKSVATSMGFTALEGLMMGSRCGSIDPGVLLYLLKEKKYSVDQLNTLLYQNSGLLGVSGISSHMRELQSSTDPNAIEAVELYCYLAAKQLAALCATLQGCNAIIFTAGIGENSAVVRKKICERLNWLGVVLDDQLNNSNATIISQAKSSVLVGIIPTNEEYMIAKHTVNFQHSS